MKSFLEKHALELGWEHQAPFIYTNVMGFDFSIIYNPSPSLLYFIVNVNPVSPVVSNALATAIQPRQKELGIRYSIQSSTLIQFQKAVIMKLPTTTQLQDLVQALALILSDAGVTPPTQCAFCNLDGSDDKATINGIKVSAHHDCKTKAIEETSTAQAQNDSREPELLKGTVGALFGAMIGSIPWILVDWFVGFYAGILGILIGTSALFFYKKFGGKVVKATRTIIIVATLLGVLFANFAIATMILINSDGLLILENYVIVYTDPELGPIMIQSLAIGLFISLFSLPTIFQKVKSEESTVPTIK